MISIKTFKIGSCAFFDSINDYYHDIDELHIMDNFSIKGINSLNLKDKGKDIFFYKNMNKYDFMKDCLESKLSMKIGKFLVPEFAEYIGLTIDDLKSLKSVIDNIDEKHDYEKIIYDAYIENDGFYLTEEQLQAAYKKYKERRINNGNN